MLGYLVHPLAINSAAAAGSGFSLEPEGGEGGVPRSGGILVMHTAGLWGWRAAEGSATTGGIVSRGADTANRAPPRRPP